MKIIQQIGKGRKKRDLREDRTSIASRILEGRWCVIVQEVQMSWKNRGDKRKMVGEPIESRFRDCPALSK